MRTRSSEENPQMSPLPVSSYHMTLSMREGPIKPGTLLISPAEPEMEQYGLTTNTGHSTTLIMREGPRKPGNLSISPTEPKMERSLLHTAHFPPQYRSYMFPTLLCP
jgi:hypothetical protein